MARIKLKLKYPKFLLLMLTIIAAYFIFKGKNFLPFYGWLQSLGYAGTFLAGVLFSYGFTAAPATAILLILAKGQNIFLAGIIGGFGSLIADLLIFKIIRHSFADEIRKLKKEKLVNTINHTVPKILKKYIAPVFAGFVIASPLPDEIGVSLLAASTHISTRVFSIFSFVLNTIGILIILKIGTVV